MKKVKLSKISGGNALRTESIEGFAPFAPQVGRSYLVLGESLTNPGLDIRQFVTSIVQEIEEKENGYVLKTLNSIYRVDFLPEDKEEDSLEFLPKEG